jgi:hypothetical protein
MSKIDTKRISFQMYTVLSETPSLEVIEDRPFKLNRVVDIVCYAPFCYIQTVFIRHMAQDSRKLHRSMILNHESRGEVHGQAGRAINEK